MPRYDFHCDHCGHDYDEYVPMSGITHKVQMCPKCQRQDGVRRVWTKAPTVIMRPDGWNLKPGEPGYSNLSPKVERYSWQRS